MVSLTLEQAQLFRILSEFFGEGRVVVNVSVQLICGGRVPKEFLDEEDRVGNWARMYKCLFTVLDMEGSPKLVVELEPEFSEVIDVRAIEFKPLLEPILKAREIHYASLNRKEFNELLEGDDTQDFARLMHRKITFADSSPGL